MYSLSMVSHPDKKIVFKFDLEPRSKMKPYFLVQLYQLFCKTNLLLRRSQLKICHIDFIKRIGHSPPTTPRPAFYNQYCGGGGTAFFGTDWFNLY